MYIALCSLDSNPTTPWANRVALRTPPGKPWGPLIGITAAICHLCCCMLFSTNICILTSPYACHSLPILWESHVGRLQYTGHCGCSMICIWGNKYLFVVKNKIAMMRSLRMKMHCYSRLSWWILLHHCFNWLLISCECFVKTCLPNFMLISLFNSPMPPSHNADILWVFS